MASKRVQLALPTPCQQPWEEMETKEAGRFCGSCQKTVVNFATMSDQQVAAYFLTKSEKICGRFVASQLNRNLAIPPNETSKSIKQRWFGVLTAGFMSWSMAQGQVRQLPDKNAQIGGVTKPESSAKDTGIKQPEIVAATDSVRVIEGRVISQNDGESLSGANVLVKGTQWGAMTDADGRFRLSLHDYPSEKLTLKVIAIGFMAKEIEIKVASQRPVHIVLAEDAVALGEVIVTGYVTISKKPTFFQRLRNRLRTDH